jgi:hypothetical protein
MLRIHRLARTIRPTASKMSLRGHVLRGLRAILHQTSLLRRRTGPLRERTTSG